MSGDGHLRIELRPAPGVARITSTRSPQAAKCVGDRPRKTDQKQGVAETDPAPPGARGRLRGLAPRGPAFGARAHDERAILGHCAPRSRPHPTASRGPGRREVRAARCSRHASPGSGAGKGRDRDRRQEPYEKGKASQCTSVAGRHGVHGALPRATARCGALRLEPGAGACPRSGECGRAGACPRPGERG